MKASHWLLLAGAFLLASGFSSDSAGRACVQAKGQRGVSYDVYKTKLKDAYSPGGRRMLEEGHRVYQVEVPASIKRDKPVMCTMTFANGLWEAPTFDSIEGGLKKQGVEQSGIENRGIEGGAFGVGNSRLSPRLKGPTDTR